MGGMLDGERALPGENRAAGVGTVVSRTRITRVSALPAQGKIIEEVLLVMRTAPLSLKTAPPKAPPPPPFSALALPP